MSDLITIWVIIAVCAVVIFYVMWLRNRDQLQWQQKQDQQDTVRSNYNADYMHRRCLC